MRIEHKKTEYLNLREKALLLLQMETTWPEIELANATAMDLMQELDIYHIELELQNEELKIAQEKTQILADKYIALYDFAPMGYFDLSENGEILELNIRAAEMLGSKRSSLKKSRFGFFVTDDTKPTFNLFLEEIFKKRTEIKCELILIPHNSEPINVLLSGITVENTKHCFINVIDITQSKITENTLFDTNKELAFQNEEKEKRAAELVIANKELVYQNEEKGKRADELVIANKKVLFNALLEAVPNVIFFKDTEGVYLGCNSSFEEFVGKPRSEIVGRTDYDLFDQSVADFFRQQDKEMLLNKLPRHNEEWVTYPNGERILLDTLKMPYNADNGNLIGIIGISRDITERVKAEEQVRESEIKFHQIFNAGSAMMILVRASDRRIIEVNNSFLRQTGFSKEEIVGKTIFDIPVFNDQDRDEQIDSILKNSSGEYGMEIKLRSKTGHIINGFLYRNEIAIGGNSYFLSTISDISDLKRTEEELKFKNKELQKVNAEKNKFFSIIAHDLRGPIGSIMKVTEILANESYEFTEAERKDAATKLSITASHTFSLLENLLEWSQLNRGLTVFEPEKLDLLKEVDECITVFTDTAKRKKIELIVNIPIEFQVFADKNMLKTVLRNMISNAIKFTPEGGNVSISTISSADYMTVVSVQDTGIGMTAEMMDNLFRIDADTKRPGTNNEKSTGLGLLLCKEFVEKQGGEITIESEPDKGTVFSFTIPSSEGHQENVSLKKL